MRHIKVKEKREKRRKVSEREGENEGRILFTFLLSAFNTLISCVDMHGIAIADPFTLPARQYTF